MSSLLVCLIEFIEWRYSQSCWYFRPSYVNYCPSNLLSGSPTPPPPLTPSQSQRTVQTVCGWEGLGGGGVLSCVGDHNLQEFNTLFLTRFRTHRIATPPQAKTKEGRGPQTDKNTCRKVPLQVKTTSCIAFYQSNLSKGPA
jgi:hypothetical protein